MTIYVKDGSGEFTVWQAESYQQKNPQTTNQSGEYAYLVPPGTYKMTVIATGYLPYESEIFTITYGNGVHMNVEMEGKKGWWNGIGTVALIIIMLLIIILLLIYHLYRDRIHDRIQP